MAAARRRRSGPTTLARTIRFYRVNAGRDEEGAPQDFDPEPVLRHIDRLPFDPDGRYLMAPDDVVLCVWPDRLTAPQQLRLASVRRSALPEMERAGALSPLNIPAESGVAERIHVVFFDNGIVGADFNFFGPRVPRLGPYLMRKAAHVCPPVAFEPLLRQDVTTQLDRLQDIRLFDLKIRQAYAQEISRVNQSLGRAFEIAAEAGQADVVEVVLAPMPRSRRAIGRHLLSAVRRLARRRNLRDNAERFHVKGFDPETGSVEEIDVLRDQLITRKQIVRQDTRTRVLDAASAFSAIEEAYSELRQDLEAAAGVQLDNA